VTDPAQLIAEGKERPLARALGITRYQARKRIVEAKLSRVVLKPGDLSHYDLGCRALAEAKTLGEVLDIHDKAAAMAEYYRRANDRAPLMDLFELRSDAARRFGEMMGEKRAADLISKGGRPRKEPGTTSRPVSETLADLGTTKRFSSFAQRVAALPEDEYAARKRQWRANAEANPKIPPCDPLKPDPETRREERRIQMRDLAANPLLLPEGPFACGIADPPWEDPDQPMGQTGRHYRDHYPTMTPDEIGKFSDSSGRMIEDIFADIAFLALWITDHHLLIGSHLRVLSRWDFEPCSLITWDKQILGLGQGYTRNQTEHVVLARRGRPPVPAPQWRLSSLYSERRTSVHSQKPHWLAYHIETWFPNMPYVNLFPGSDDVRPGWVNWGLSHREGREAAE
jgi:N6-adenosine-specific RNA methylase IME4